MLPKDPAKHEEYRRKLSEAHHGRVYASRKLSPIIRTEKECTVCHHVKSIEMFGLTPKLRDGHNSMCKACDALAHRAKRMLKGEKVPGKLSPIHIAMNNEQLERFVESFTLVDHGYSSQCWQWDKVLTAKGYGRFRVNGRKILAHRASYENFVGSIPERYEVDHLCKNRACVNPDHLEAVTHTENVQRSVGTKGTSFQHKISRKQFQWRLKRQGFCCYYCKIKLGEDRKAYHLDHVIPLARGGTHDLKNIVFACPPCNMRKNNKTLEEWAEIEEWLLKSPTIRERIRRDRASIMTGRKDALCIVIEEPPRDEVRV